MGVYFESQSKELKMKSFMFAAAVTVSNADPFAIGGGQYHQQNNYYPQNQWGQNQWGQNQGGQNQWGQPDQRANIYGNNQFAQNNQFQGDSWRVVGVPTQQSPECYVQNVDIDGNYFRTNVIDEMPGTKTVQHCQHECLQRKSDGCEYFVYEQATHMCTLYNSISQLEYDDDEDELKVLGYTEGCVPCHRPSWDYVKTGSGYNLVGRRSIHGVDETIKCAQLCMLVPDCMLWSHDYGEQKCYLKNAEARNGLATDYDFISGAKGCITKNCMLRNKNFEDGYWSSYSIIGNDYLEMLENVSQPQACQAACQLTAECTHWTLDKDDNGCYLVDSPKALEYSNDKVSG